MSLFSVDVLLYAVVQRYGWGDTDQAGRQLTLTHDELTDATRTLSDRTMKLQLSELPPDLLAILTTRATDDVNGGPPAWTPEVRRGVRRVCSHLLRHRPADDVHGCTLSLVATRAISRHGISNVHIGLSGGGPPSVYRRAGRPVRLNMVTFALDQSRASIVLLDDLRI
jgi:hypothetical protein